MFYFRKITLRIKISQDLTEYLRDYPVRDRRYNEDKQDVPTVASDATTIINYSNSPGFPDYSHNEKSRE